ncbi:MAG: carbohydrate kinase family protein [Acidimicrobiales bacterium]|nr:carbohydrate kinase family protein [Acidimicrobiales bacterium]
MVPSDVSPGPDLLVVGDLMVDVVVHYEGVIAVGSDTPSSVRVRGGGSAANTAAWSAHLGLRTRLLAALGEDDRGGSARRDLADVGVELVGPVSAGSATGTCVVLVGPDGERTMFPDRGANADLRVPDVTAAFDVDPAAVHLSAYLLFDDRTRDAARHVLSTARNLGVPVSVDAASAAPITSIGSGNLLAWLEGVDLVFANDDEVAALGGEAAILDAVVALVAKHGPRGSTWTDGRRRIDQGISPTPEGSVLDTTGAGDAFSAGYLAARHRGGGVERCLAAAASAASTAVRQVGARPIV